MYSFLFNQTYLSIFAIAILVFLLMFLWRKLTILEGNYYLLEKRVNIIKKEGLLLDPKKSLDNLKEINTWFLSFIPKFIIEWYGLMAAIIAGSLLNHLKNNSIAELKITDVTNDFSRP